MALELLQDAQLSLRRLFPKNNFSNLAHFSKMALELLQDAQLGLRGLLSKIIFQIQPTSQKWLQNCSRPLSEGCGSFFRKLFFKFGLLPKNGSRIALGRCVKAVETFFENYFSNLAYFSKTALELLQEAQLRLQELFSKIISETQCICQKRFHHAQSRLKQNQNLHMFLKKFSPHIYELHNLAIIL